MTRPLPLLSFEVRYDQDVAAARRRSRQVAALLGLTPHQQTRIATAVSEIARNALQYAGGGRVELSVEGSPAQLLVARVRDRGPGITDLESVLEGRGAATGVVAARRLADHFRVESAPGRGTDVTLGVALPKGAPALTPADLVRVVAELAAGGPADPVDELREQNRELLATIEEARDARAQLARLNRELEDTNRGVVALYAELDEKATSLQRASDLKTRFLANMTHEFRTPLNSILSLSRLLLDRVDGELTPEQAKQAAFIRKSAEDLSVLVNDLLDLAKVEAGKVAVRVERFEAASLFGALRGVLRPIHTNPSVDLVFEEPSGAPTLVTDEGKVSQILRNFVSNALKFTERGEVRVSARPGPDGTVVFAVSDTGIGIAAADRERIFEEFVQVEGPHQGRVKGTGLGLPLSRRLAELLGGSVSVESEPGVGSTFSATIPDRYGPVAARAAAPRAAADGTLLVVDDDETSRDLLRGLLRDAPQTVVEAAGGVEGLRLARELGPKAIFLDLVMPDMSGDEVLAALGADPATRDIPVIIRTSKALSEEERRRLAPAAAILSKGAASREAEAEAVRQALARAGVGARRGAEEKTYEQ